MCFCASAICDSKIASKLNILTSHGTNLKSISTLTSSKISIILNCWPILIMWSLYLLLPDRVLVLTTCWWTQLLANGLLPVIISAFTVAHFVFHLSFIMKPSTSSNMFKVDAAKSMELLFSKKTAKVDKFPGLQGYPSHFGIDLSLTDDQITSIVHHVNFLLLAIPAEFQAPAWNLLGN